MYYVNFPGGFGNFLTILVITRNNHLHNHMTPLLLNLAFGKICVLYFLLSKETKNSIYSSIYLRT